MAISCTRVATTSRSNHGYLTVLWVSDHGYLTVLWVRKSKREPSSWYSVISQSSVQLPGEGVSSEGGRVLAVRGGGRGEGVHVSPFQPL